MGIRDCCCGVSAQLYNGLAQFEQLGALSARPSVVGSVGGRLERYGLLPWEYRQKLAAAAPL